MKKNFRHEFYDLFETAFHIQKSWDSHCQERTFSGIKKKCVRQESLGWILRYVSRKIISDLCINILRLYHDTTYNLVLIPQVFVAKWFFETTHNVSLHAIAVKRLGIYVQKRIKKRTIVKNLVCSLAAAGWWFLDLHRRFIIAASKSNCSSFEMITGGDSTRFLVL